VRMGAEEFFLSTQTMDQRRGRKKKKRGFPSDEAKETSPVVDLSGKGPVGTLQEHMVAIVECSDDAIISLDLQGVIRSWNQGAKRIFGYHADQIMGRHISTLAAPHRIDEIPKILARIARGERIDHYQTERKTKDGRILFVSLTISPVRDASGQIIGASKIARDVTEQVKSRQALERANELLARSNADLEHFAYSASHDLQEPLRMVSIYSEMLQRKFGGKLGADGDEYIAFILEGAARMEQLLKDLRAYAHSSKTGEEGIRDLDSAEVLGRVLISLKPAIDSNQASITHGLLPWVRMHEFQLEQLFQNLIGNAIRYRSERTPEIHVSATPCDRMWQFSVQDNGIGIDPQYREQIFGIFKRLHSAAEYPGTGMGLAICQRIVERLGGRIWVESEPGRGSTFLFTVPAARKH